MSRDDVVKCTSCGYEIVFLKTAAGKDMPVNAESVEDDDVVYEHGRHVNHWGTCPRAAEHRKPRK